MVKKIACGLAFLWSFFLVYAQNNEASDLKVGLVLSGGGAKGLAHIGVLKAIEEAGIRVDYIGGTSMGAIVGALYASGYSANQLDSIFNSVDFDRLIQDQLPRSAKTFYEKENSERYAITLPFNRFKVSFPSAISKGQNVYNLFSKLLMHVNDVTDFNQLPIPFFCIATDIETGEAIVLNKGYLPEAISASGAFPSLFEPVEIDGRVLIDGGVVNNYPIDEVKAMGVDVIIGVDVQDALSERAELTSATGILLQINNYRTVNDMKKKSKKTDVYIKPDIKDFTVISFDKGLEIIKNGYDAAKTKRASLDSLAALQQPKIRIAPPDKFAKDSFLISSIGIRGFDRYTGAYIRGKLRLRSNEYVSFEKFNQGISNLSATNNFNSIHYKLLPDEEKEGQRLLVNVTENPNDLFLRLGVHYDGLYQTAGLINVTKKHLLMDDDVASFDFILGDRIRYKFDYYIDKGFYWSYGFRSFYNSFHKDVDFDFLYSSDEPGGNGVNRIDVELDDITNQLYMQTVFREEFTIGGGLEHKYLKIDTETLGDNNAPKTVFDNSSYVSLFGFLTLDTYDDKYFPERGLYFNGDFHWYLSSTDFTQTFEPFSIAKAEMGFATPLTQNISLNVSTEGGFKIGETPLSVFDFVLGGYGNDFINNFTPFLGYDFLSFGGDSYVKATLTTDWEFSRRNHLNVTFNMANAGNGIFENKEWVTAPDFTGYAVGYGLETFLGPVEAKYTWSPDNGNSLWVFSVGFWF